MISNHIIWTKKCVFICPLEKQMGIDGLLLTTLRSLSPPRPRRTGSERITGGYLATCVRHFAQIRACRLGLQIPARRYVRRRAANVPDCSTKCDRNHVSLR